MAKVRDAGLPPTFAAFITAIAVLFHSVTISARAAQGAKTRSKPSVVAAKCFMTLSLMRVVLWAGRTDLADRDVESIQGVPLLPERPIVTEEMAPADLWVTIVWTGAGRKGLPTGAALGER